MSAEISNIFQHGSSWLRCDFHLHTRADKEFTGAKDLTDAQFISKYLERLKAQDIRIGVIANHNKFDCEEYRNLSRAALKDQILLLPGVELSVGDGSNGIHIVIAFEPSTWLVGSDNFIEQFLVSAFEGIRNRENENTCCKYSLKETLLKLDEHRTHGRDPFVVLAHVEQSKGFCEALKGGRITELAQFPSFRQNVLALQKVRSRDNLDRLNIWFDKILPASVEGSDCKTLDDVGRAHSQNGAEMKSFLKLGSLDFNSVKFALCDHSNRLAPNPIEIRHSVIEKIEVLSNTSGSLSLPLNGGMNNLIGIRGSGKSCVLETLRYTLGIPFGDKAHDTDYKESVVEYFLGSGGKVILHIRDSHEKQYRLEKVYGDRSIVFEKTREIPNLNICSSILKVLYFGQKDLSRIGEEGFSQDLIDKFFGTSIEPIKQRRSQLEQQVKEYVRNAKSLSEQTTSENELLEKKATIDQQLKLFKEKKVDQILKKQVSFEKDLRVLKAVLDLEEEFGEKLYEFIESTPTFEEITAHKSDFNGETFERATKLVTEYQSIAGSVSGIKPKLDSKREGLKAIHDELTKSYESQRDEFAKIKREIKLPNLKADDFVLLTTELDDITKKLGEIKKRGEKLALISKQLGEELTRLQQSWHEEFVAVKQAIDHLNAKNLPITIVGTFKGHKEAFAEFFESLLRGKGIHKSRVKKMVAAYSDPVELYLDLQSNSPRLSDTLGDTQESVTKVIRSNLETFLTYRVPDKFDLLYRGRELSKHSLGQRASALMIFLLTSEPSDLIMIDQPEDDLDSQSIYNEVVCELKKIKSKTQFLFATHNPNIPVLGDCEQVIVCANDDERFSFELGSIDRSEIQRSIVDIMEGGRAAFEARRRIYENWQE